MGPQVVAHTVRTTAAPALVHALLRDGAGWPAWSPLDSFVLESEAPGGGEGVGAVRVFRTGRHVSRERIVASVPDRHFAYVLLSGLPLRDYRADVELTPGEDGGTTIRWRSVFRAKVPGTGWIYRAALHRFTGDLVRGLARHADAAG
ncbi:SRPBCC family protein [Streptomyces abyssomicinicus]|uniref:SRPBCC family protein n=1 Tax=Streptomyces abyssomicinicus TaxID=574929 RepID=UPI00124F8684|nr:SRPBCC family protein [Streptomyces abyssomicinicus]